MASLTENATRITNALNDIKAAIIAKGQTPTGRCETFADAISKISGGGSNVKVFNQKWTMASNEVINIECGFKPKFIWLGKSDTATPLYSCFYNEDASTTQFLQATAGTMRWLALGNNQPNISAITNTGFSIKNGAYNGANVQVIAIG